MLPQGFQPVIDTLRLCKHKSMSYLEHIYFGAGKAHYLLWNQQKLHLAGIVSLAFGSHSYAPFHKWQFHNIPYSLIEKDQASLRGFGGY